MKPRPWYLFSSSSGQTLSALWRQLDSTERATCLGIFIDRPCGALEVARALTEAPKVELFERPAFEEQALSLAQREGADSPLVLLCGFFGILSAPFLKNFPAVVVNTHPSLLPSFPGMDKRVHRTAAQTVALSGFTVHLVTEELDGGTVLFQHPVWVDTDATTEQLREDVRRAEQALLPIIWKQLLRSDLSKKDLGAESFSLRKRLGLNRAYFKDTALAGERATS